MFFVCFCLLVACGGGGDGSDGGSTPPVNNDGQSIKGFLTKAPIDGASCSLYSIDVNGAQSSVSLATGLSLTAAGVIDFGLSSYQGYALISCNGGTYTDEATGKAGSSGPALKSVINIQAGGGSFIISPLTQLAVQLAGNNLTQAITTHNAYVANIFGLDGIDITQQQPADMNVEPANNDAAGKYGMALSVVSQYIKEQSVGNSEADVDAALFKLGEQLNTAQQENNPDLAKEIIFDSLDNFVEGGSEASKNSDSSVVATLKDNRHAPIITSSKNINVVENIAADVVLFTVTFTDDDTYNESFVYNITEGNKPLFEINNKGEVSLKNGKNLDRETGVSHTLTVTVNDGINTSTPQTVTVTVKDVNDNPPVITSGDNINVSKNTADNAVLLKIAFTDADSSNGTTTYALTDDTDNLFEIDGSGTISLQSGKALDYGTKTSHTLTVTVNDGVNTSAQSITINVLNPNNEAAPVFTSGATVSTEEGTTATTYTATATDADLTSIITYSITGGVDQARFSIAQSSGVLSFKTNSDFENPADSDADNEYRVILEASDGQFSASQTLRVTVIKNQPLLVMQIAFNDHTFDSSLATWSNKIFGSSNNGQLNHYYREISQNKYQFKEAFETQGQENDGIISVSLNEDHPGDIDFFSRITNVISEADQYINFSQYDTNNNGAISIDELQIMLLVAGGEASAGSNPNASVWAHAWCFSDSDSPPVHDEVKLMGCSDNGTYSMFGEKHQSDENSVESPVMDASIGIIAHELGHAAFDLPDLYDADEDSEGIGDFGLMGAGSWGYKSDSEQSGRTPVHMTAWSKIQAHFIAPLVITKFTNNAPLIGTSYAGYKAYKVTTDVENEYFLLENRAGHGYDQGLSMLQGINNFGSFPGGLLILHIDDEQSNNDDKTHKLVDVEEANNAGLDLDPEGGEGHRGHLNNLFFSGNATEFTPITSPNSNRYDGSSSGISITDIVNVNEIIYIDINVE